MTTKKEDGPRRVAVMVLGMHRSGTSAMAGMLSLLGCDMPKTRMAPSDANEKGYFESGRIYQFHTRLLESAGSSWDDWLPVNAGWFNSPRADEFHEAALAAMESEFGASRLFCLKDPRICRLVPFWEKVLADLSVTPRYLHVHRNPLEVAASLKSRDGLPVDVGLLLWLRHVVDAESGTRGRTRCFASYGQLLDNWGGLTAKIQDQLDISLPRVSPRTHAEVEEFLAAGLRHFTQSQDRVLANPTVSDWVRDTYAILERWAEGGEDSADFARLDAIRAEMNASAGVFGGIVELARGGPDASRNMSDRVAELEASLEKEQAARGEAEAAVREETDRLKADLAETRSALEQRSHEADQVHQDLKASEAEMEDLRGRLAAAQRTIQTLEKSQNDWRESNELLKAQVKRESERSAGLQSALQTQSQEIANISRMLSESETAREAAAAEAAGQQQRAEAAEHMATELMNSTSWKLTFPLRAVLSTLRK